MTVPEAVAELTFVHAEIRPHEEETRTGAHQIGIAFSAHEGVSYRLSGRASTASYAGGALVGTADEPIVWSRVREPTEALEIYPDIALVQELSGGRTAWPLRETLIGHKDPVVLAIASRLRRAHVTGSPLDDVETSAIAHRLVAHLLVRYAGMPARSVTGMTGSHTRLTPSALGMVADTVDAALAAGTGLTLGVLSDAVHLSPFHFTRAFRASVGSSPWQFVTARRLDRARLLLRTTDLSVEAVASAVGVGNLSHFRRIFSAHTGCTPGRYRRLVG